MFTPRQSFADWIHRAKILIFAHEILKKATSMVILETLHEGLYEHQMYAHESKLCCLCVRIYMKKWKFKALALHWDWECEFCAAFIIFFVRRQTCMHLWENSEMMVSSGRVYVRLRDTKYAGKHVYKMFTYIVRAYGVHSFLILQQKEGK